MTAILASPLAKKEAYRQAFVEAASSQRKFSENLAAIIERASKDESVRWGDVMQLVIERLNISPEQLRLIAKVSLSTISRWRSGDSDPHALMRESAGSAIAKYIRDQAE